MECGVLRQMLRETIKLVLLILGTLILVFGPVFLSILVKKRHAAERRSLGMPPQKRRTSPLAWLALLCLLGGGCFMVSSAADLVAKDKVIAANNMAKNLYRIAGEFAREAEAADCVTTIAQFSETDTPLKARMHKEQETNEGIRSEDWYAVVFREGRLECVLWSGNQITPADLHEPDHAAERRKVKWGHSHREALGYYAKKSSPVSDR